MIALLNTIKALLLSLTTHIPPPRSQAAGNQVPRSGPSASFQLVPLGARNNISNDTGPSAHGRLSQVQPWNSRPPIVQRSSAQSLQGSSPPTSCFKKSSFWTVFLGGLAILTGLLFFLLQWLYMNWTARNDFIEHCEGLQDTGRSLSVSCEKALKTPLASPPFSSGWRLRRYITDTTPLAVILFFDRASTSRRSMLLQLCYISLFLVTMIIGYSLVAYCSNMLLMAYHSHDARPRTRVQTFRSLDEEEILENDVPMQILRTGHSTAVDTSTSGGLRSRFHNIVADVDITSILAPRMIESMPNGSRSQLQLRKRTRFRTRDTNKLTAFALPTKPLQSDKLSSDLWAERAFPPAMRKRLSRRRTSSQKALHIDWDYNTMAKQGPAPDTVRFQVTLPRLGRFFGASRNYPSDFEVCLFVCLLVIWRLTSVFLIFHGLDRDRSSAEIDGLNINTKAVNALDGEDVQQLLLALSPPRPLGDFFRHGLDGNQFIVPPHIIHSLRVEFGRREFRGEILFMTERELFVVNLLFPEGLLPTRKHIESRRLWFGRPAQYFLEVEAFKCAYTKNTRKHELNSCPQYSPSFPLWTAKLQKRPTMYHFVLRIGVNIPRSQWNSKQLY